MCSEPEPNETLASSILPNGAASGKGACNCIGVWAHCREVDIWAEGAWGLQWKEGEGSEAGVVNTRW